MLSEALREMRREFQDVLLEAGDCIQISALQLQSYVLALAVYEDTARDMEREMDALRVQRDRPQSTSLCHGSTRPQLTVISNNSETNT